MTLDHAKDMLTKLWTVVNQDPRAPATVDTPVRRLYLTVGRVIWQCKDRNITTLTASQVAILEKAERDFQKIQMDMLLHGDT